MLPPETSNYFFWLATSLLTGTLIATYTLPQAGRARTNGGATFGSGFLGLLAAGCPVCNKLVVLLLGVSGALNYFAPIQPMLGAAGLLIAGVAVFVRLRSAQRACQISMSSSTSAAAG